MNRTLLLAALLLVALVVLFGPEGTLSYLYDLEGAEAHLQAMVRGGP